MQESMTDTKRFRLFSILEFLIIVLLAIVPLFSTFPYRVNIFLSWEGAYRLSEGQIPYRDFGMPMGYMYWVIPAIFFKIFGAQLITLVKAQVLINILSGLAFRSILKNLGVAPCVRLLSVMLYCISFSFFNFWPWYNHTVIVYEMIGLAFLMNYVHAARSKWIWLSLSALFLFFSFFTKQDGGALALLLALVLLSYHCFFEKQWKPLLIFIASYILVAFAIIAPLTRFDFGYWFNHGQPPHTARISPGAVLDEFLNSSQWIKFYFFLIALLAVRFYKNIKELQDAKRATLFLILVVGILAEATVLQVTSYTPPDNNIFFHAFAIAFILSFLSYLLKIDFSKTKWLLLAAAGIMLWWSPVFWKYLQRISQRMTTASKPQPSGGENVVNRDTYMLTSDSAEVPVAQWTFSRFRSFEKIYLPKPTIEGIERLMRMNEIRNNKKLRLLNMSELTPLAVELPYREETGPGIPLWYHLGVAMFNKQAAMYEQRIKERYYDVVLFEYIPTLNNFYPFRVRDSLIRNYNKVDSFYAPRRGSDTKGMIEVYTK